MLTKDVCYKALNQLQAYASQNGGKFEQEHEILSKLIKQHFDNPPLSFDELEAGMWVWNNGLKMWLLIKEINSLDGYKLIGMISPYYHKEQFLHKVFYAKFEENTYYRKQVEE